MHTFMITLLVIITITLPFMAVKLMVEIDKLNSLANDNQKFLKHHIHRRLMYITLKRLDLQ